MSLLVGWHFLSDDEPSVVPPAATFLDVAGSGPGMRSAERLCRIYFKGRPQPDEIAQKASAWHQQGCRVQLANEPNLPAEGFGGGPADYVAWFAAVKAKIPGVRCYWAGMSPGVPGWKAWYAPDLVAPADGIAAHAYGSFDEMRAVVEQLLPLGKPIWLAEINFGAGREMDRDAWARIQFRPFLDWCSAVPQIEAVTYFAYRWPSPDMALPTPVDATPAIETELAAIVARQWAVAHQRVPVDVHRPESSQETPMLKRAYLHQFDQLGETSVAEVAATLRLGGVTEIACKTHQEVTWLGRATNGDMSPLAFRSESDVRQRFEEFAAEGIRMVPWCVPMGTKVPQEIEQAILVGRICGVVELDTEPYAEFWEGPLDLLEPYTDGIQAAGVPYEVNFDARPSGWHPFTAAQFARVCRDAAAVWTQSYWTTFQRDAEEVVAEALATLAQLEVPRDKTGIIYPWDGPGDYERVTRLIAERAPGVGRIGMWRMGTAGPPVYQALAAIPTTASTAPVAVDAVTDAKNNLWDLTLDPRIPEERRKSAQEAFNVLQAHLKETA